MKSPDMQAPAPGGLAGEPAGPEEQAQYDRFVDNGFKLIYDAKAFPAVMDRLVAADDPVEGLASVIATVVSRLGDDARDNGVPLTPDVMLHGGAELLADLADTAGKAGLHAYTEEEIEGATYRAMDLFREIQGGAIDRGAAAKDLEGLKAMDASGELDRAFPGLAEHVAKGGGRPGGAPPAEEAPEEAPAPAPRRGLLKGGR